MILKQHPLKYNHTTRGTILSWISIIGLTWIKCKKKRFWIPIFYHYICIVIFLSDCVCWIILQEQIHSIMLSNHITVIIIHLLFLYFLTFGQDSTIQNQTCINWRVIHTSFKQQTQITISSLIIFPPFIWLLPGCPQSLLVDWSGKGQVCWTRVALWANISKEPFLQDPP